MRACECQIPNHDGGEVAMLGGRLGFLGVGLWGMLLVVAVSHAHLACAADPQVSQQEQGGNTEPPSQEELFRRFEERLSGAQLVGFFTTRGDEASRPLREDRYTIDKVSKGKGDFWLFEAHIQYNNQDTKLRMPLEVKWAGDTPVITLTKVFVPGLGTFTARVLIYENEYAGTWDAGDHGGHLFGRIERGTE
jgi:hypothetical protein